MKDLTGQQPPRAIAKPVEKGKDSTSIDNMGLRLFKYGEFQLPYQFINDKLDLSINCCGGQVNYKRVIGDDVVEKIVLTKETKVLFNPVEPVNLPQHISPYLMVEFTKPIQIESKTKRKILVKFPVEIGVFIRNDKKYELIDIFTFTKLKYTLYTQPRSGVICRYWVSEIYSTIPSINPNLEGLMELTLDNHSSKFVTVKKVVLNAYGMELFYDQTFVSMVAKMKILSEMVAETEVLPKPYRKGMRQSHELYTTLKAPILMKEFVMEVGL